MRKKFCNFLGVVLAVSLMIPGGALNAFADESTSGNNASQAATEQALNGSEAKDQETQEEQTKTVSEDKQSSSSEQQVFEGSVNQEADGTRAGPSSREDIKTTTDQDFSSNLIAPVTLMSAVAAPKVVDVNITNFEIQTVDHKKADTLFHSDTFLLKMDWNATGHGTDLHEGDYFDIDLPNNMKFPSGTTARDFDITDDNGNVIAHAHVTPGPNDTGGKVHVTFGKGVENKYNVKGSINLAARFDETKIKKDQENKFDITVNGNVAGHSHTATTGVNINGSKPIQEEYLTKWGQGTSDKSKAEWWSRINFSKATLTNAVVTDSLGSSGMTYIKDSFILRKVVYDKMGDDTSVLEEYKANDLINSGKLKFSADMTSFTLSLGNTSDQYRLIYRTTYVPGTVLKNHMKLDSDQKQKEVVATHQSAESGGSASGDLASKIKLIKVDEDGTTPLKDAVFTVTKPDGSTFELTTGADGTVTSGVLVQGTYKVKEKTAPKGYELGTDEYTLQVTPTGGAIQKVTNKPTKISLPVKKSWIGPKVGPVTVHLLADGVDTGKTVTLDEASGWKGQFDNLRKCKPDGTEIVYTVKEDDVPNYTGAITGDATTGFTITNTNTEKVNVPVKKTWVGPKAGPVTVHLLADGTDTGKTVTLNEANSWADTFSGLDKYKADGTEIVYTVKEDDVPNYTGAITGDATTGFTITNTNTEKVNVPVKKTWVGPKAGPVTVHLLADGTDTGKTVTLNEANSWADTFSGLDKYKADGTEIVYTVKEDDVPNYTGAITGDVASGFTITNTNTEKVNVPVKKTWVGPKAGPVTVHLLADGTDTGKTVTLNEANSWADTFSGLDKYKADGTEIVYTVKEDDVPNYTGAITGDATTGFTITNTNTEKVNVPVKKTWVGPKAGPVTVHLLADGTDTGKTVTLNEANSWADTFSGLDKYKADGTEIVYTVKEDDVAGYTSEVTGDANTGFTVTNTQIPPHETPKPKKPSKKVQKVPYTGDAGVLGTVVPLTAGAIVLLGAGIFLGKKDK